MGTLVLGRAPFSSARNKSSSAAAVASSLTDAADRTSEPATEPLGADFDNEIDDDSLLLSSTSAGAHMTMLVPSMLKCEASAAHVYLLPRHRMNPLNQSFA